MKKRKKMSKNVQGLMTDEQMYKVINDFANHHPLAADGEIQVTIGGRSFKALTDKGITYEDAAQLDRDIDGALRFMLWVRRNGIVRFRELSKKTITGCQKRV